MAKGNKYFSGGQKKDDVQTSTKEPEMWTPGWLEANKDKFADLGVTLLTQEELDSQNKKEDAVEETMKELGIDPVELEKASLGNPDLIDVTDLINKMATQIDLLTHSSQWRSTMTQKMKTALIGVRVFIRQLRNELPPPGQAANLAQLIGHSASIPTGVMGARAVPTKRFKLTQAHLEAGNVTTPAAKQNARRAVGSGVVMSDLVEN